MHHFPRAVDVVADDRLAGQERLRKARARPSRRLAWTRMSIAPSSSGIFVGGTSPVNWKWSLQSRRRDLLLQLLARDAIADEQKAHVRMLRSTIHRRGDHVLVTLELKEPRDLADHHVLGS